MKKYIEVVKTKTGEVVKRFDITGLSDRAAERLERGVNINMNHDEYHSSQKEYDEEMPLNPTI